MLKNRNLIKYERHPFHLVDPSPWPLFTGYAIFAFAIGLILTFCGVKGFSSLFFFWFFIPNLLVLILFLYRWFYDIVVEGTFEGQHTNNVQNNILLGMKLFIVSEVMFFFSFFWGFFHFSILPSIFVGASWPTYGIVSCDPIAIPLANTVVLVSSGFTVTLAHKSLLLGKRSKTIWNLIFTIILGALFTSLQAYEYYVLPYSINTDVFGSVFFMLTGFHGFHVLIGTIFLIVSWRRMVSYHFLTRYHIGLICAIWYWHFVDIVWLALYAIIYIWGR